MSQLTISSLVKQGALGWPECAKCEKPVDTFELIPDMPSGDLWAIAGCHGEYDKVKLGTDIYQVYKNMPVISFGGLAFTEETKQLSQPKKELAEKESD